MTEGCIAFVCQIAIEQRYLLSQAGKAPDERVSFDEWKEKEK